MTPTDTFYINQQGDVGRVRKMIYPKFWFTKMGSLPLERLEVSKNVFLIVLDRFRGSQRSGTLAAVQKAAQDPPKN